MQEQPTTHSADGQMLVLTTERQVYAYDLSSTFRIAVGRHDTNDIQLASRTVSNFHAEVMHEEGRLVLRDLGSTNGTYINEAKIHEAQISSGDCVRIGNYIFEVKTPLFKHPWNQTVDVSTPEF